MELTAQEARNLVNLARHPRLNVILRAVEYWASQGKYSISVDKMPEQLINNLTERGYIVKDGGCTVSWEVK